MSATKKRHAKKPAPEGTEPPDQGADDAGSEPPQGASTGAEPEAGNPTTPTPGTGEDDSEPHRHDYKRVVGLDGKPTTDRLNYACRCGARVRRD